MKEKYSLRLLVEGGLIAALYVALTVAIAPAAFGPIQLRLSEMLTILPVFTPAAVPGLAVGCLVSNLFGLMSGANPAGALDLLLGPLATLAAAVLTRRLRGITVKGVPLLSTLPPVLINAAVVGPELAVAYYSPVTLPLVWFNILCVGAGQLVACTGCGLLLHTALYRSGAANALFRRRAG
ncbi:MAG: QueT transporter family protein [Clostridiales bacterium]|nr:QueT transporter family protein [Clostridiales bacterium]